MPAPELRPPAERSTLAVDVALVALVAAVGMLLAWARGLAHSGADLGALFVPNLSWWWSHPRLGHGWNPWVFGGVPANADPELGQLHPIGLVYALAPPFTAAALEAVLTPTLAGAGMLLYLRRIGCARGGALVGALSFALGGFMAGHAVHPPLIRTAAAVPWVLVAIEALDGPRLVAGAGLATALLLAGGHPQTVTYAALPLVVYALLFGRLGDRRRFGALLAGGLLGVGATAGMWLPAAELVARSTRWALGPLGPLDFLSLSTLHSMVVPFAYGGGVGALYGRGFESFPGCGIISCTTYPGMLVWVLVLAGVPVVLRNARGRFWAAVAVLAVAFASGAFDGLLGWRGVRGPARMLLWWNVAAAIVAGLAWGSEASPRWRRWAAVALLVGVIGWSSTTGPAARRAALGSIGVLGATVMALAVADVVGARARWLPVAVLAADLVLLTSSLPFAEPARPLEHQYAELTSTRRLLAEVAPADGGLARTIVVPLPLDADWAPFAGTPLLQGYNPLVPRRLAELLGGGVRIQDERGLVSDPTLVSARSRVLDLLRCRLVRVAAVDAPLVRAFEETMRADPDRWVSLGGRVPRWRAWLNRRAAPVAWLVHRVRVVPDEVALRLVRGTVPGADFDPVLEALTEQPIAGVETAAAPPPPVEVVEYGEDVVRLRAEPAAGALLVTSDLAYPGWRVRVAGVTVPVHVVDGGVRAVVVPAGRHEVVFEYAPPLARAGLAVSAASVLALAVCLLRRS